MLGVNVKERPSVDQSVDFFTKQRRINISRDIRSILIVDEDGDVLNQLSQSFAMCAKHYSICIAQNGRDALTVLGTTSVNILLTTLTMPVMNDFDLIDYTKIYCPDTRIFVMSEEDPSTIKTRLDDLRIYGYIRKPLRMEMVYSILRV
ncbi:MAG: response regulator [Thermodesulfovibrionales bacterium]|jgi:two-component system response regulator YesN